MIALVLSDFCTEPIDVERVVRILLELIAGDTPIYGKESTAGQEEREADAAGRLFGMLPDDRRNDRAGLWR